MQEGQAICGRPGSGRGARAARNAILLACAVLAAGLAAGCARYRHHEAKTRDEFRERFDKATAWALKSMDATDEQKARMKPITDDLANALWDFRTEHQAIRDRFIKAFEADKVDPAELAKIREDGLALAGRASAKFMDSLARASEILTPAQRRKLAEHWKKCR